MEAGVKSLERRQTAARERLEALLGTVETAPKEPENRPHIYNYNPTLNLQKDTVIAANKCSGEAATGVSQSPAPVQPKRPGKGMVQGSLRTSWCGSHQSSSPTCAGLIRPGRTSSTPPNGCAGISASRNPSGATPASPWAANWQPWRWRSSRPRRRITSRPRPAVISTAWSPNISRASCISSVPSGPCSARSTPERHPGRGERSQRRDPYQTW